MVTRISARQARALLGAAEPAAPTKFRSLATTLDGHRFASRAEARRYSELLLLRRAGRISGLVLQPRFPLLIGDTMICTYIADFEYVDACGTRVIEDVKSPATRTAVYRIKKKMMRAILGIEVIEVP